MRKATGKSRSPLARHAYGDVYKASEMKVPGDREKQNWSLLLRTVPRQEN